MNHKHMDVIDWSLLIAVYNMRISPIALFPFKAGTASRGYSGPFSNPWNYTDGGGVAMK